MAPLLDDRLQSPNAELRAEALRELAMAKTVPADADVTKALIEALDDDDPDVKEWATVALRRLKGNHQARQALWSTFDSDPRESVRCCAPAPQSRASERAPTAGPGL